MAKSGPKPIPLSIRFWRRVLPSAGDRCWLWLGNSLPGGYGSISGSSRSGTFLAHRVSWELAYGSIPIGMMVCHHCDVRSCVRPDHLFLGTATDNMRDCSLKGRSRSSLGELNGRSLLSNEKVRFIKNSDLPTKDLAARFGMSIHAVWKVRAGRTWKHIPVAARKTNEDLH